MAGNERAGDPVRMFPLSAVLFPNASIALHVFEDRYRVMLDECLADDRRFGVVLISHGSEVGGGDRRFSVGTTAFVEQVRRTTDGRAALLARGESRFRISRWLEDDPYPRAHAEAIVEPEPREDLSEPLLRARASVTRARALMSEVRDFPRDPQSTVEDDSQGDLTSDDLTTEAWRICDLAPVGQLDRQRLIECDGARGRLEMVDEMARDLSEDLVRLLSGSGGAEFL